MTLWFCLLLQTSNQLSLIRSDLGFVYLKVNRLSLRCGEFLSGLFCFSVFSCAEGEVCQTAGSAAQLPEDRPVHVPGTDSFSLS